MTGAVGMNGIRAAWHRFALRHHWVWADYLRLGNGERQRRRTCSCGAERWTRAVA